MSYKDKDKDNGYVQKHCSKNKNLRRSISYLERFCRDERCELHIFGSITRRDYYDKQSDCDVVILCNNVDDALARMEYLVHTSDYMTETQKPKQFIMNCIPSIESNSSAVFLYRIRIHDIPIDVNFLKMDDFAKPDCVEVVKSPGKFYLFFFVILKFFYYKLALISEASFIYLKHGLQNLTIGSRYSTIKEIYL